MNLVLLQARPSSEDEDVCIEQAAQSLGLDRQEFVRRAAVAAAVATRRGSIPRCVMQGLSDAKTGGQAACNLPGRIKLISVADIDTPTAVHPAARTGQAWLALKQLVQAQVERAGPVSASTRTTYEANAKILTEGWDARTASKASAYVMRAAGLWTLRRQLGQCFQTACDHVVSAAASDGLVRFDECGSLALDQVQILLERIEFFMQLDWRARAAPGPRLQASHKQQAAGDDELLRFYAKAQTSSFLFAFLVAEFSGCLGEEFANGVEVQVLEVNGVPTLQFCISPAGPVLRAKGMGQRRVQVPWPADAAPAVRARWSRLQHWVLSTAPDIAVVRISASSKMSAGQRFTNACKFVARSAGVSVAATSFRQRFAAGHALVFEEPVRA